MYFNDLYCCDLCKLLALWSYIDFQNELNVYMIFSLYVYVTKLTIYGMYIYYFKHESKLCAFAIPIHRKISALWVYSAFWTY